MAYSDDVVIIGSRQQDVEEVFTSVVTQTNKMGLEINERKTKFMLVSRKPYNENEYLRLGTHNFERVEDCIYFGKILTNKNELIPAT